MPIHKVGTLIILWFYTPYPSSLLGYPFGDPFPNNVRTLSSIPQYQKKIKENFLFRFLAEKKYFVDYPLFWHSCKSWQLRRAVREAQCLGLNIFLSTCWDNFFSMAHAKTKLKKSITDFSKYLPNNSRKHSNHHKNYAKTLFCSRILHSHFQSRFLCESIFKWANCRNGVFLTCIWIPGRTCAVEVWLNKSAT